MVTSVMLTIYGDTYIHIQMLTQIMKVSACEPVFKVAWSIPHSFFCVISNHTSYILSHVVPGPKQYTAIPKTSNDSSYVALFQDTNMRSSRYRFLRFSTMADSCIFTSSTMSSTPLAFLLRLCQWYACRQRERGEGKKGGVPLKHKTLQEMVYLTNFVYGQ